MPEGIVVIAPGEGECGNMPGDYVSSLLHNPIVAILDAPCPITTANTAQEKLDCLTSIFSWHMVHNIIFVSDNGWTLGTFNGALAEFSTSDSMREAVLSALISRLAAPVVPPRMHEITVRTQCFDSTAPDMKPILDEFTAIP